MTTPPEEHDERFDRAVDYWDEYESRGRWLALPCLVTIALVAGAVLAVIVWLVTHLRA